MPTLLMCFLADTKEDEQDWSYAYPSDYSVQRAISKFCLDVQNLQLPPSALQTRGAPLLTPAGAVEQFQTQLEVSVQQDLAHFSMAPATVLFADFTADTTQAANAASMLLQAQDIGAALQSAVPKVTGLPHKLKSLLQRLQNMHLKVQTSMNVSLVRDADSWTGSMVDAFQAASRTFQGFPDTLSSLMQSMTKLAAMSMCFAAASTNSAPPLTSVDTVIASFDHLIDQLHANMLIRTDSVWQTHAQVQLLKGFVAKVLAQKQERSRLLSDAHRLLANPALADVSSTDSISAALASVSSQQHGMVVIANVDGVPGVSSPVTTVDFGTVLSNSGTVLRTIRLVNNCSESAHIKVSS